MLKLQRFLNILLITALLLWHSMTVVQAQPNPLSLFITDIDATSASPNVDVYVSVLNEVEGQQAVGGLPPEAFVLTEEERVVTPSVGEESVGLALVILMDRSGSMADPGAIAGQTRMDTQREIVVQMLDTKLTSVDLVGVIGFHEEQGPVHELTHDHNSIFNTAHPMQAEPDRNTSLFDTAGRAIDWLTDHTDPVIRAKLQRMRKAILLLSDGADTTSTVWSRADVRNHALSNGIRLYTVAVDSPLGAAVTYPSNPTDLQWLAEQTRGEYFHVGTAEEQSALSTFLDGLVSQRTQYRLSYQTQALKGDHPVKVAVIADGLTAEATNTLVTDLEPASIRIIEPEEGIEKNLRTTSDTPLPIVVEATFPDGKARELQQITIFTNGENVGLATPDGDGVHYRLNWLPEGFIGEAFIDVTLSASGVDSFLPDQSIRTEQTRNIRVMPTPLPTPPAVWWLSGVVAALAIGLITLLVLLILMRRRLGQGLRRVGSATSTVLRTMTRPLMGSGPATAKLRIINGPNIGAEYRIDRDLVSIGRDPRRCEIILTDPYISGVHLTIERQANDHYVVTHRGSNNTEVNQSLLQKDTPMPLSFNSKIQLGTTEMQFLQIGGQTVPI